LRIGDKQTLEVGQDAEEAALWCQVFTRSALIQQPVLRDVLCSSSTLKYTPLPV
jgi:hypothetical protein